jgi:alkylated DNA repair dioxygenase AlkB
MTKRKKRKSTSLYYHIPGWAKEIDVVTIAEQVIWEQKFAEFFGRRVALPRLTAFYADSTAYSYTYSGIHNTARIWTPLLQSLRDMVSQKCSVTFNCCLLNLYCDGSDYVGWHADDEPVSTPGAPVASLSLGTTRTFGIKGRTKRMVCRPRYLQLSHGDLLVMESAFQEKMKHTIKREPEITEMRVNLTFRCFYPSNRDHDVSAACLPL